MTLNAMTGSLTATLTSCSALMTVNLGHQLVLLLILCFLMYQKLIVTAQKMILECLALT